MGRFDENVGRNKDSKELVWHFKGTTGHGIKLGGPESKVPAVNFYAYDGELSKAIGKAMRGPDSGKYQHFLAVDREKLNNARIPNVKEIVDVTAGFPEAGVPRNEFIRYDHPFYKGGLREFRYCQVVRLIARNKREIHIPSHCILAIGGVGLSKHFVKKIDTHNQENEPIKFFRLKEA